MCIVLTHVLQCIALEYSKRGAKVVLAARRKEKLEEVQKLCLENGATDAAVCPTDVSSPDACENLVNFTLDTSEEVCTAEFYALVSCMCKLVYPSRFNKKKNQLFGTRQWKVMMH